MIVGYDNTESWQLMKASSKHLQMFWTKIDIWQMPKVFFSQLTFFQCVSVGYGDTHLKT